MIKPAILFKEQITMEFNKYFYTQDMFYETGCIEGWVPEIEEHPNGNKYQWAIVDSNDKLIGFISYYIDRYTDSVNNFGLLSFDRGNVIIGKEVYNLLEDLASKHHRVEWRAIGGNPANKAYEKFCKKHNGTKHILKDACRDADGIYHDDIIYEIVKDRRKNYDN